MERYTRFAAWYDLLSVEPVYGAGRHCAIPALGLRPGDRVLDVGCGTGLNVPALSLAVGDAGLVVGVDRSPHMLRVARAKTERAGLNQVRFVEADATRLTRVQLERATGIDSTGGFDAVIFTYSLSLMSDVEAAWRSVRALLRASAGVAVVDMQKPTGVATLLAPAALLACWLGGADIHARPWLTVERDLADVRRWDLRGGHIQVRVGHHDATSVDSPGTHGRGSAPAG